MERWSECEHLGSLVSGRLRAVSFNRRAGSLSFAFQRNFSFAGKVGFQRIGNDQNTQLRCDTGVREMRSLSQFLELYRLQGSKAAPISDLQVGNEGEVDTKGLCVPCDWYLDCNSFKWFKMKNQRWIFKNDYQIVSYLMEIESMENDKWIQYVVKSYIILHSSLVSFTSHLFNNY